MKKFTSFSGTVMMIDDFITSPDGETAGCYKLISVVNGESQVNFVVSPSTYFLDQVVVGLGDWVTGFYDVNAPVPFIYPPQYQAIIMVKASPYQNVKVDYFNKQMVSSDGQLKLNLSPYTQMILTNNQLFTSNPANRNLLVVYGPTTKSIPAQTTPYKLVILCQ